MYRFTTTHLRQRAALHRLTIAASAPSDAFAHRPIHDNLHLKSPAQHWSPSLYTASRILRTAGGTNLIS